MSTFSELELRGPLLAALEKIGFTEPTEIQEKSIRAFESGKNIIGQSHTGTGKTGAFVIPLLNRLDGQRKGVQALVLCPTRELAIQTQEEFRKLSLGQRGMNSVALYGGGGMRKQMELLARNPRIVVGTPGRVRDLVDRKKLDLSGVEYFVLDEADRMLDMGFVDEVRWLRDQMPRVLQTLCFSATMPQELFRLLHQHLGEETIETIKIAPKQIVVENINHNFLRVDRRKKLSVLQELLERHAGQKVIIFTQTKRAVDHLAEVLGDGEPVFALHGDVQQYERIRTIKKFKANEAKILIATDVVGRGLNLDAVDLVLNYDVPQDPEAYVHRIGRTARAGADGKAIMLVTEEEFPFIWAIEKANKLELTEINFDEKEIPRTDRKPRNFSAPKFARRGGSRGGRSSGGRGGNSRGKSEGFRGRGGDSRGGNSRGGDSVRGANSRGNSRGGRPQGARSRSDRRGGNSPAKNSDGSREKDAKKYFLSGNVRRQFQVNERDW